MRPTLSHSWILLALLFPLYCACNTPTTPTTSAQKQKLETAVQPRLSLRIAEGGKSYANSYTLPIRVTYANARDTKSYFRLQAIDLKFAKSNHVVKTLFVSQLAPSLRRSLRSSETLEGSITIPVMKGGDIELVLRGYEFSHVIKQEGKHSVRREGQQAAFQQVLQVPASRLQAMPTGTNPKLQHRPANADYLRAREAFVKELRQKLQGEWKQLPTSEQKKRIHQLKHRHLIAPFTRR